MKHSAIKPLAVALLLGVMPLTITSAMAKAPIGSPAKGIPGPVGPAGPRGLPGLKGAPGTHGLKGAPGVDGLKGADGTNGTNGAPGVDGLKGADGTNGTNGAPGVDGLKGADGTNGTNGAPGVDGLKGADGTNGTNGAPGVDGLKGADGTNGTNGTNGAPGASGPVHAIDDLYQGGIIFWVDADGQHGLIAAKADQSEGVSWFDTNVANAYQYNHTGTTGDGIYAGISNTTKIVAQQNALSTQASIANSSALKLVASAAQIADNYSIQEDGEQACTGAVTETCYGDWYLPSKVELNLLYNQKNVVGGFADLNYWSSTENDSGSAWLQAFSVGFQFYDVKGDTNIRVRAVRAF